MRALFATICNDELMRLVIEHRLHAGTQESLGRKRGSQLPLGSRAAPLEAVGVPTPRGIHNAEILWNALIDEAREAVDQRGRQRAELRRRLAEHEQALAAGTLAEQAESLGVRRHIDRLDATALVLDEHARALAEYDVLLAMAQAPPNKTIDTCRNLLGAISSGHASAAERRSCAAVGAAAASPGSRSAPCSITRTRTTRWRGSPKTMPMSNRPRCGRPSGL